ncbi:Methyltransferase-like protein 25 [Orchesella cincta]|uniref:Methyltransferase-like protein 25 n=1 Tax=Orchesella cincta TaxID=48709 RepID=A0A1D2NES3_ORCCI|nr:Methyltransferase-like protein 25 [Orchesella cincta]
MTRALKQIGKFLEPALIFLNCHFTDYYLKSYWTTLIPPKLRQDLESKSLDQVKTCMIDLTTGKWREYSEIKDEIYNTDWNFDTVSSLEQLIVAVGKLKLAELGLCTSYKKMEEKRNVLKQRDSKLLVNLEFDNFMASKKMHEVMKFSEFIACSCEGVNLSKDKVIGAEENARRIENIVDVGSGKGYLSSFLAMYYNIKVLAIDASASNTDGCEKRTAKLDKRWPQLVRRAKERRDHGTCANLGRHWKKTLAKQGISVEEYVAEMAKDIQSGENNLKSVTEMITTKTDLQNLVSTNLGGGSDGAANMKYGIVGLHTCGNLGANILKLFLHNENANFICVVPCCYNLVREDENLYKEDIYYGSKLGYGFGKTGPWPDGSIGFPLSTGLKEYDCGKPYVVGRNARMLSAYSLPRMVESESGMEMPPTLYYRGMLQVLLKRHNLISSGSDSGASDDSDMRVGRMTKPCSNFRDYVTFALNKLPVEASNILTDGSIEDVESTYATPDLIDKFHKYYLLRAMFASVVEDLILLDRMVYLLEQESIADANLIQLFNPALSPRSHAIVAVKKS